MNRVQMASITTDVLGLKTFSCTVSEAATKGVL